MKNRNYGIDLLRLVFMFMICMWHILGHGGVTEGSLYNPSHRLVYGFLVVLMYCAVDGFALISGYVSSNKPQKYERIVSIWFQVFFYSFILTTFLKLFGYPNTIENSDMIKYAFPIVNNVYWYMTAYFALFFAMPIFNKYISELTISQAKRMLLFIIVVFSILAFLTDPFQTAAGYSAIWLMILYIIGALMKKVKLFESVSTLSLIQLWFLSTLITWFMNAVFKYNEFISYLSPTILFNAMIMLVLFSRIKLKGNLLSKIAPLALGIYLFHLNPIIWGSLQKTFSFIAYTNLASGLCYVFFFSFVLFITGLCMDYIREKLFKLIKIEELSKKIVLFFDQVLNKITKKSTNDC